MEAKTCVYRFEPEPGLKMEIRSTAPAYHDLVFELRYPVNSESKIPLVTPLAVLRDLERAVRELSGRSEMVASCLTQMTCLHDPHNPKARQMLFITFRIPDRLMIASIMSSLLEIVSPEDDPEMAGYDPLSAFPGIVKL